jgi:hypothetical protein
MPLSNGQWEANLENLIFQKYFQYNTYDLSVQVHDQKSQFNNKQKAVYHKVMDSVLNNQGKMFFLQSAGSE